MKAPVSSTCGKSRFSTTTTEVELRSKERHLTNAGLAELLALEAEKVSRSDQRGRFLAKALRKASRVAFTWPEEASILIEQDRSLTELPAIGPYLAKVIQGWIQNGVEAPDAPPIRQNFFTLSEARQIVESQRAWARGYKGDLQMHTTWSDGSESIMEMAEAGLRRGYEFVGITDHSKGLKIAGGIDERELRAQGREIQQTNARLAKPGRRFRILRSIELNLNPRGEGDMDPAALGELDLVVGSFHSALRTKEDQTERYLAALRNPMVDVLGHPRGRIYNYRIGLSADWPRVLACAAELDKAVEIDAYADRQDLDVDLLRKARRAGARIAIDTDAHHAEQLDFATLGLAAAIKARIPAERIVNFMSSEALLEWVRNRRQSAAARETAEWLPGFSLSLG
jgi:histidinol phosphatase-like PHP family hydrolase